MLSIGVDVGGTFTDVVSYDHKTKVLSVGKIPTTANVEDGILNVLQGYKDRSGYVSLISHATTIATNALLTRTGLASTALITNSGFRDVLEIGRQRRGDLYDLNYKRPAPLVLRRDRFTVNGRILADGTEQRPLSRTDMKRVSKIIKKNDYDSVVIGFLNSYMNPKHEMEASKILSKEGFAGHIDISSDVCKEHREFERFSTAAVNGCLSPLVSRYLAGLSEKLQDENFKAPIYVMNSDGSASTIKQVSKYPILMVESGPAAGVLASRHLARTLSLEKILTFDMGGTTAKAGAVVNYKPDISNEFEAAGTSHSGRSIKGSGYTVRAPFIDLAEVSAGGGTVAFVDEAGALRVGPKCAGSEPGPAAYGRGGVEPTITDANVVLGRISSLLGGDMKLRKDLARQSLSKISAKLKMSTEQAASGIIRIVNNSMARVISIVSVERGRDPRDYVLVAFGGGGPIHSCDLAEELEISKIVIPPHAGLFSAFGLLTVDVERNFSLPVMEDVSSVNLERYFSRLREIARRNLAKEMKEFSNFTFVESVEARYVGQTFEISVPYKRSCRIEKQFNLLHKKLYGYSSKDRIEIVNAKLRAIIPIRKPALRSGNERHHSPRPQERRMAWFSNKNYEASVFGRELLRPGTVAKGPCIIEEYDSTTVVNPMWSWKIDEYYNILLTRRSRSR